MTDTITRTEKFDAGEVDWNEAIDRAMECLKEDYEIATMQRVSCELSEPTMTWFVTIEVSEFD
jgi:hypothetical protein